MAKFPTEIFPEKIKKIIEVTSTDLNFPHDYIAASLFFAVAVAVGTSRVLKVRDGWVVKPILYMALLGRPGAMKTHPVNFALAPFCKSDVETLAIYAERLEEYRMKNIHDKPKAEQIVVKDATIEAVAKVLLANKHGICLHCDELAGWFNSFNRYRKSGGDEQQWLSLYNGDAIVVNRKSQDDIISIPNPFVSVIGSLQPDIMVKCFKGQKTDNGFLFRMLFVDNTSDTALLWQDEDLPSNATNDWYAFLMDILLESRQIEHGEVAVGYHFSKDAWDIMRNWQNMREMQLADEGEDYQVAIFRKIQDYALRFCLIVQVMCENDDTNYTNDKGIINPLSVARAIALAEYFFNTAKNVYDSINFFGKEELPAIIRLLEMLPQTFSREQALQVGGAIGISRATIFRHLTGTDDDPFTLKIGHGKFQKK